MTSMTETYSEAAEAYTVAAEVAYARHTEQCEGAGELGVEDVRCSLHAAFTARHQPVEVRTADERRSGSEGHRGDDVAAGKDAAVDVHLGSIAHGVHDAGQYLQRSGSPVELASAVVGHDDGVGTGVDNSARVGDRLDAFDDQWPRPRGAEPRQVVESRGRVEHLRDQFRHRSLESVERGELQDLGG